MKKTVLITGTSSGIGRAAVNLFTEKGWNVIATMRKPENEKEWKNKDNILVTTLDVEKTDTIRDAVAKGIRQFGTIDVLVNNAGIGLFGAFEATPEESIRQMFEVNLFGPMQVIKAILPHFREQKNGMIVNISSSTGLFTIPLLSVYSASKYALEGFSESLSFELSAQNIKVKLIEPGMVDTNFDDATQNSYKADPAIKGYDDYLNKIIKLYSSEGAGEQKVTAGAVAEVLYQAIADGSDTLRYMVGEDVKGMVAAKASMPGQEYIDMMRKRFKV